MLYGCLGPVGVGGPLAESCLRWNSSLDDSCLVCACVFGEGLRCVSRLEKLDMNERTAKGESVSMISSTRIALLLTNPDFWSTSRTSWMLQDTSVLATELEVRIPAIRSLRSLPHPQSMAVSSRCLEHDESTRIRPHRSRLDNCMVRSMGSTDVVV